MSHPRLLLGERDLHRVSWGDLEALECVLRRRGLDLVLELHEGDVLPPRNLADFLEPGESGRTRRRSGMSFF